MPLSDTYSQDLSGVDITAEYHLTGSPVSLNVSEEKRRILLKPVATESMKYYLCPLFHAYLKNETPSNTQALSQQYPEFPQSYLHRQTRSASPNPHTD